MISEVLFDNGVEKKKMREFVDDKMMEFDDEERVIYKGEYVGSISDGFKRGGIRYELKYNGTMVNEVMKVNNGEKKGRYDLNEKDMKEYEGDILVYEGEYCMNDYDVLRNGNGVVFCSSNHFYTAVFENGIEKMKMKEINGNEMVNHDNKGRVLYRGEYEKKGNDYLIKGKGQLYVYDGRRVSELYECENGDKTVKRATFELGWMN